MRQSVQRERMGPLLSAVLPDRDSLPGFRRGNCFPLPVGGRAAGPGDVRLRRGAGLHRDPERRVGLRVAARRAGLGLGARPRHETSANRSRRCCKPMLIDKVKARFTNDVLSAEEAHGEETIVVGRDRAPEILRALRDEPGFAFDMLTDLTALDWPQRT